MASPGGFDNHDGQFHLSRHSTTDFIDNRLQEVDPVFNELPAVKFNDMSETYTLRDQQQIPPMAETEEMKRQQDIFLRAVEEFNRKHHIETSANLTKDNVLSWADVLRKAQAAEVSYRGVQKKGIKRSLRGLLRKFQEAQKPVQSWLRLLPSDSWQGSLLCGGLSILFDAAARLGAMREDTFAVLEEIPVCIEDAYAWIHIYSESHRRSLLEENVSQMFVAILAFIELTLSWYSKHPMRKFAGAVMLGDEYGRKVSQSRDKLRALGQRVSGEASLNQHLRIKEINDRIKEQDARNELRGAELLNKLYKLLQGQEIDRLRNQYYEKLRKDAEEEQRQVLEQKKELLLDRLDYNPSLAIADLQESLRTGPTFYLDTQDRTAWMLHTPEVKEWLSTSESRLLSISGNEAQHDRHSAASLFSAMLIHSISASDSAVVLHWFCGQHASSSVHEMTESLICQLLEKGHRNIRLPKPDWLRDLDDPEKLPRLFNGCLKQQLRYSSVYLILDSISFYEDRRRRGDLHNFIDGFSHMMWDNSNDKHWLKVLLTSPIRCDFRSSVRDSNIEELDVPDVVDGAYQGLNEIMVAQDIEESLVTA